MEMAWRAAVVALTLSACGTKDGTPVETDETDETDDTDPGDTQPAVPDVNVRFRVTTAGATPAEGFVPVANATCAWVRRSGEAFDPPVEAPTDADGNCTLSVPGDRDTFTVRVSKAGSLDVLAAGYPVLPYDPSAENPSVFGLFQFTEAQADAIYAAQDETRDESLGYVLGAVAWLPTDGSVPAPVGCASVVPDTSTGGVSVYLGGNGLPAPTRTTTHPGSGLWVQFDVDPANYGYTATVGGESLNVVVPILPNAFTSVPLFFRSASNPTPANCE